MKENPERKGGYEIHTEVLMHSIRMISPRREMILESREFLLEGFNMGRVFEEEDLQHTAR
jgi:hypothetical protein